MTFKSHSELLKHTDRSHLQFTVTTTEAAFYLTFRLYVQARIQKYGLGVKAPTR